MSDKITWDQFFMSMAYFVSMKSKDPSSRIGAILVGPENEVLSLGYNGLPRGVKDDLEEREERPIKYAFYEHGERNAIYNAARTGVQTVGSKCYTQGTPCADCARALIQAGIREVIVDYRWDENPKRSGSRAAWLKSAEVSLAMFKETGVKLRVYRGPLINRIKGLFSGDVTNLDENE